MNHLRRLSVFVDEPKQGNFHWVLHESAEDASVWMDVASSDESFPMWIDAWDAGNVALLKLVDDERVGPRAPGEDEETAPMGSHGASE
ncbi:MAG: hypothetical protein EOP24_38115 [Hyphomicrobiales bacterium]|nr:MAG: hypothetical protein EOP24_38115 [Hyphomicrobiales bacterium]